MRKAKGNIRKMLAAIVLTLLCCSAFAQRIVESGDLRTTTDEQHGTVVHYLKGGKRPLSGKFRILRGQDEEIVHFSKGVMQGEYRRFRNGSLREKGKYTDGRRHGLFVSYHQDGKTPQREAPMQYGKIDGTVRTWFSDGKSDMVQEYRQGKRNGKEQRFDPKSGKQIYEANYTDDRKEGKQWKISEDTTERWVSKTVSHYKNGELDGPYEYTAHLHGKLYAYKSGSYKNGYKPVLCGSHTTHPQQVVYAVGCYLLVGFRCCPFASYNKIPILGNTVVAAVSFVCRLGLGSSRGVFKD